MVQFENLSEAVVEEPSHPERIEAVPEHTLGSEGEEKAAQIRKAFTAHMEYLLKEGKNLIGKGSLAEVYPLEINPTVCVKVINDSKKFGTIASTRLLETPFYNSPHLEASFLSDMQRVSGEVGVPKPFYSVEHRVVDEGGMSANISALAMERLDAVSIAEVLNGEAELPAAFESTRFWKCLRDFVTKMHEEGIYHRDLHGGNVMIGKSDARPYVIDFGTAVYATEHDAYERPTRGKVTVGRFIEDFAGLEKMQKELERATH